MVKKKIKIYKIRHYTLNTVTSSNIQRLSLSTRKVRSVNLVTYLRVDKVIFPDQESFGKAVKECLEDGNSNVRVLQWVYSEEKHAIEGTHYHLAVKLSETSGCLRLKQ